MSFAVLKAGGVSLPAFLLFDATAQRHQLMLNPILPATLLESLSLMSAL